MKRSLAPRAETAILRPDLRREGDAYIRRYDPKAIMDEYADSEDAIYGPGLPRLLHIEDDRPEQQVKTILEVQAAALADAAQYMGVAMLDQQPTSDDLEFRVDAVVPDSNASIAQKLSYINGLTDYYGSIFNGFIDLLDGKRDRPDIFHTDLSKPGQYVFGSVGGDPVPKLYFVDYDIEITTVAIDFDGAWVLEPLFVHAVFDLAAVSYYLPDKTIVQPKLNTLFERMRSEGTVGEDDVMMFNSAIASGYWLGADQHSFATG